MKDRDWKTFIDDMIDSIEKIERYTRDMDFHEFEESEITIDAVTRNLEIIGEACRNIPDEMRDTYPEIPWRSIIGLRNIVIHQYFGLDLDNIWHIIKVDMPRFKGKLHEISQT